MLDNKKLKLTKSSIWRFIRIVPAHLENFILSRSVTRYMASFCSMNVEATPLYSAGSPLQMVRLKIFSSILTLTCGELLLYILTHMHNVSLLGLHSTLYWDRTYSLQSPVSPWATGTYSPISHVWLEIAMPQWRLRSFIGHRLFFIDQASTRYRDQAVAFVVEGKAVDLKILAYLGSSAGVHYFRTHVSKYWFSSPGRKT